MKTYTDRRTHAKSHAIKVGDTVLLKVKREGKLMLPYKPIPYKVITVKGSLITAKQENSDHTITRNCSFFKLIDPIKSHRNSNYDSDDDFYFAYDDNNDNKYDIENNHDTSDRIYPLRTRRRPSHLQNYVV